MSDDKSKDLRDSEPTILHQIIERLFERGSQGDSDSFGKFSRV